MQVVRMDDKGVVYQCCECREIVGDSTSHIETERPPMAGYIFVLVAPGVEEYGETVVAPMNALDARCAYVFLRCRECKTWLGKRYLSTTSELDILRKGCTLDSDALMSYRLGGGRPKVGIASVAATVETGRKICAGFHRNDMLIALQKVLLALDRRLQSLESRQEQTMRALTLTGRKRLAIEPTESLQREYPIRRKR